MKSFRTRLKVLNESSLSSEAQALHDKILPLLKPMQDINYYYDNGDQVENELYEEKIKSIKSLEKILGDPEVKQEHFNEAMLHLVNRRTIPRPHMEQQGLVDPHSKERIAPPNHHTVRLLLPVFTALPIGRINNFMKSLPENFVRENFDDEDTKRLHYHILSNSRHTSESLKKSIFLAYSHGVEPSDIREAVSNPKDSTYDYNSENKSRFNDDSITETMRLIHDHHKMESFLTQQPYMTSADRRKIEGDFDDYPRRRYVDDDDE